MEIFRKTAICLFVILGSLMAMAFAFEGYKGLEILNEEEERQLMTPAKGKSG